MKKAIEYVKQNKIEIIYFVLFLLTMCIWFLPFITINLENNAESTYFLSNVLSGWDIEWTAYSFKSVTVLYGIVFGLYIVSLGTWITSIILERKESIVKKYCYLLNLLTIVLIILFMFMFIFAGPIISFLIGTDIEFCSTNILFGVFLFIPILFMCLILFSKITEHNRYTIKEICETGILVGLAVILDLFATIKIHITGGSISFCAVPLFIIGIRYGAFKGTIASSLYFGFITCLLDGYGIQTFPFDYLVAFSGYGFVGLYFNLAEKYMKNKELTKMKRYLIYGTSVVIGSICAMVIRYVGHTISSVVLYSYTVVEGIIYNTLYVPGAILISMAITIVLIPLILYINKLFPADRYKSQINDEIREEIEETNIS